MPMRQAQQGSRGARSSCALGAWGSPDVQRGLPPRICQPLAAEIMGKGRGKGGDAEAEQLAAGCCGLLVCISLLLLLLSFSTVEPLEVGLHFSKFSNKIVSDKPYHSGRYFLGLGHSFITFPTQAVTIDFSNAPGAKQRPLATRTSDGLPVTLEISMQYVLKTGDESTVPPEEAKIIELYTELNTGYEDVFVRFVRDTMLEVAGRYDSRSYWEHRGEIGAEMQVRSYFLVFVPTIREIR
eukprot:SAG31_NODE_9886_length_1215_cov_2.216846_1_plen_238_part_01